MNRRFGLTLIGIISILYSGELTYTPINPAFGGNSFNAQWMMNEAQAQNEYTAKREPSYTAQDPLEDFKESLNRQILSRFSREIISAAFGESEDSFQEGTYQIGDYTIEVTPDMSTINIVITDDATGNTTTIEVPYYGTETGEIE